jgi:osmotically-inducible protein OsmY
MNDQDLARWVFEELYWDPRIDGNAIVVSAHDGDVTLRGTVGGLGEKRDATKAARRVHGVKRVHNELAVRLLTHHARVDADLRGAVLRALELDSTVPATVDAHVHDGSVTLTGSATWQYQRDEAERVAASVPGVRSLVNEIELAPTHATARDVKSSIERAFARNARIDAQDVAVDTLGDGTVVLTGSVGSWTEHDAAVAAAWSAPGVTRVEDYLELES